MTNTGRNQGISNFHNRLSEEDVLAIFNSDEKQVVLAKKYGVQQSTINHIKKGRTWGWLTGVSK